MGVPIQRLSQHGNAGNHPLSEERAESRHGPTRGLSAPVEVQEANGILSGQSAERGGVGRRRSVDDHPRVAETHQSLLREHRDGESSRDESFRDAARSASS